MRINNKYIDSHLQAGYFIDWLTVSQEYSEPIPIFCQDITRKIDADTGELKYETRTFRQESGSYATSISIKSDGTRLTISGNPSRFNRPDNLFGYTSFGQCINVYNELLSKLCLPELTYSANLIPVQSNTGKIRFSGDGCRISQVHITKNFSVGKGNEKRFIRSLGSFAYRNKMPFLYPDGNTIDWLKGSRRLYIKLYNKSQSLIRERKKLERLYNDDELLYYDNVIDFCIDEGVVRLEYEFKSNYLNDKFTPFLGFFDVNQLLDFNFIEEKLKNMKTNATDYLSIADLLIENEVCKTRQSANATQSYYMMWLNGMDISNVLNRSQFYVHKKRLKAIGIDITVPMNVSTLPIRVSRQQEISVNDLNIPSWYLRAI
jgi:II/X family phage/plasmid replication protein